MWLSNIDIPGDSTHAELENEIVSGEPGIKSDYVSVDQAATFSYSQAQLRL